MKVEEGNKLIAEFMGVYSWDDNRYGLMWKNPVSGSSSKSLQYHSSWGWIMPVVEKIESIGGAFHIYKRKVIVVFDTENHNYTHDELHEHPKYSYQTGYFDGNKVERIYECAIQFIQWYNQTLKAE